MMYMIDSAKLKYILATERCLKLNRVSKMCGMHADYISNDIEIGRISEKVVKALDDKFEINPVRYVIGWKGGKNGECRCYHIDRLYYAGFALFH